MVHKTKKWLSSRNQYPFFADLQDISRRKTFEVDHFHQANGKPYQQPSFGTAIVQNQKNGKDRWKAEIIVRRWIPNVHHILLLPPTSGSRMESKENGRKIIFEMMAAIIYFPLWKWEELGRCQKKSGGTNFPHFRPFPGDALRQIVAHFKKGKEWWKVLIFSSCSLYPGCFFTSFCLAWWLYSSDSDLQWTMEGNIKICTGSSFAF